MAPNANQEHHECCGDNKKEMEEEDDNNGVKTIDCLRARLLAERRASKLANEETLFLGHKLMEVENKLEQETKLRNKADYKLKSLLKKLQSLNIVSPSLPALDSYLSDSSEITDFSSTSSADKDSHSKPLIQHQHSPSTSSVSGSEGPPSMEMEKDKVDNSLAIVAVGLSSELITVNKNVSEVLEALKNAREKLLMERRRDYIYD